MRRCKGLRVYDAEAPIAFVQWLSLRQDETARRSQCGRARASSRAQSREAARRASSEESPPCGKAIVESTEFRAEWPSTVTAEAQDVKERAAIECR